MCVGGRGCVAGAGSDKALPPRVRGQDGRVPREAPKVEVVDAFAHSDWRPLMNIKKSIIKYFNIFVNYKIAIQWDVCNLRERARESARLLPRSREGSPSGSPTHPKPSVS